MKWLVCSKLTLDGWEKLLFIAFCIPIFSQVFSIYCVFSYFDDPSSWNKPGEPIIIWSIIIFLILSVGYFIMTSIHSTKKMSEEIQKQDKSTEQSEKNISAEITRRDEISEIASIYLSKLKDI